jgi:hypothetical protein
VLTALHRIIAETPFEGSAGPTSHDLVTVAA